MRTEESWFFYANKMICISLVCLMSVLPMVRHLVTYNDVHLFATLAASA
jgi:hypothetical protein